MNGFMKRIERIRTTLTGRKVENPMLVYADGSQRSMGFLEALDEVTSGNVVDVLAQDETTSSLLRGMLGPWDFSDLEELSDE